MSDYLNNLVARTLQRQEVVSPRLVSLYEKPAIEPFPVSTVGDATDTFEKSLYISSTIQPSVAPPSEVRQPAPSVETPQSRPRIMTSESERQAPEVKISDATTPHVNEQATVRPGRVVPSNTEDNPRPPRRELTEPPATDQDVTRDTVDGYDPKTGAQHEGAPTIEAEIRALDARLAALEVKRSDDTGRLEDGRQLSSEDRPAIHPSAAPNVSPRVGKTAGGFESHHEPARVTVTIGRVDVRAVFPASNEAPRRTSPPCQTPTTLAEYLQKRERGRP